MFRTEFSYSEPCLQNDESYGLISKASITSSEARYSVKYLKVNSMKWGGVLST